MIAINFIFLKGIDLEHLMHSNNDNEEININDKEEEVIGKHLKSLLNRY